MTSALKRTFCLLLVLILALGMIPSVYAAEADSAPLEPEIIDDSEPEIMYMTNDGISLASVSGCQATTWATVWVNTDEYSSVAGTTNRFIYYDFAGKARNRNNVGLKAIKVNGTWQAAYCLEPGIAEGSTYTEDDMTMDEFVGSSAAPSTLTAQQLKAMCVAVMYGQRTLPQTATYEQLSNMVATQIIVWEIAIGWRSSTPPYQQTNDAFIRRFENVNGIGPEATSMYITVGGRLKNVISAYNQISADMAAHTDAIPSFTSASQSSAPTIELTANGSGQYTATVTDTNKVLSGYTFPKVSGVTFSTSGNTLTITSTTPLDSVLVSPTKNRVNTQEHPFFVWYNGSYQVMLGSRAAPNYEDVPVYFRIKAVNPTGSLKLTKTTEDGKNLSGWRFGIYSDSGCTNLISGPHTTDSSGAISVSSLTAGTYYVKELGHTNSTTNALYTCASTNPQKVTISAGATATVRFSNVLVKGNVKLVKTTNTGNNLGGWQIGLYTDSACTTAVSGSPFTTGTDGTITVSNLTPGTYYARELSSGDPYWAYDTAVKAVTVKANETASVTFTNTHYGRIEFRKTTNTGNQLGGWTFRVQDSDGKVVGEYTTDENGYACTENFPLGRYNVIELPTEDAYWTGELGFHDVTVKAGQTVVDEWLNREQGLGWFYKQTNTGTDLEGWEITVYRDKDCTDKVGTVTTNAEGKVGYYLDPGTYWAKETGDTLNRFDDEYWQIDDSVYEFEIKPHEDVSVTFQNTHCGKIQIIKTMEGDGPLSGWQFKITDSTGKAVDGSPFTTDASGLILTGNLQPGEYKIEELIPENSLYHCTSENPQTVTVKAGETAKATFTNALRPGKITAEKVDSRGEPLAGAKFLLEWSEDGSLWWPIEYSESIGEGKCSNSNIEDGCLTSGKDGLLEWTGLHPGLMYRVTELEAPDGFTLLTEPAYEGTLPVDTLTVSFRVVNCETFTLPQTGSTSVAIFRISQLLCIALCSTLLICSFRKERRK